jgi:hypothetical protein
MNNFFDRNWITKILEDAKSKRGAVVREPAKVKPAPVPEPVADPHVEAKTEPLKANLRKRKP